MILQKRDVEGPLLSDWPVSLLDSNIPLKRTSCPAPIPAHLFAGLVQRAPNVCSHSFICLKTCTGLFEKRNFKGGKKNDVFFILHFYIFRCGPDRMFISSSEIERRHSFFLKSLSIRTPFRADHCLRNFNLYHLETQHNQVLLPVLNLQV
jgi:hypothetical protein